MGTEAIAGMAMNMQTQQLQQQVGASIMKMAMDSSRESANALVDMMNVSIRAMERSVQPHLGSNLDVLA